MSLVLERRRQGFPDAHGDCADLNLVIDILDQDDEFIASEACEPNGVGPMGLYSGDGVNAADTLVEALRDRFQQRIAHAMSEGVINPLEPVEIQVKGREFLVIFSRVVNRLPEPFREKLSIRQAGQVVVVSKVMDFCF